MGKTRVYDLATSLDVAKEELVDKINGMNLGFTVNNYMSQLTDEEEAAVREAVEKEQRRAVVEERIRPTVIRRRSRGNRRRVESAPASEPAVESKVEVAVARPAPTAPVSKPKVVEPKVAEPEVVEPVEKVAPQEVSSEPKEAEVVAAKAPEPAKVVEPDVAEPAVDVAVVEAQPVDVEVVAPPVQAEEAAPVEEKAAEPRVVEVIEPEPEVEAEESFVDGVELAGRDEEASEEPELVPQQARVVTGPRPSNIAGFIDPEVIRKRLAKDNKTFTPGPAGKSEKRPRTEPEQSPRRKVVNQRDLYTRGGQNQRRRTGRSGRNKKQKTAAPIERPQITQAAEHKRVIRVSDTITVSTLAHEMGVKSSEIIKFLMGMGMMMTVNQPLDVETAELVAQEFGFSIQDVSFKEEEFLVSDEDSPEDLELRPPCVTVMGHVDHGKTSLLDAIRDTRITASEAGGITQHIGASTVSTSSGELVFLDTPGHEAFTALRARGAKVTDLVVLVVAADDGVMPQTVEAINHSRAADVPILVAINKIDKPGANPQRVKQALTEYELIPEDWGGSTIFVEVSALTGDGIEELLEMIQLQSELLELRANPDKPARGVVLEAFKHSGRGTVATVIVQEGTLHDGDIVVSGPVYGRVRTMTNEHGKRFKVAGPSTPAEITGLSGVPEAGEAFFVVEDEKTAKDFTEEIKMRRRNADLANPRKVDPWAALKETKQLNVIIKADVQGSVEALGQSLEKLCTEEVEVVIRHSGVGGATESDVQLAVASNALIIGFNTRPEARALEIAKRDGVSFENFTVIYDVIDMVRAAMAGLLDPTFEERSVGAAEVRDTFSVPKVGMVAGCYVTDGKIVRGGKARLVRQGKIIYDSRISSLRRFKDDAKEVKAGFECGLSIDNYNDVKVGDVVEVYEMIEIAPTLD